MSFCSKEFHFDWQGSFTLTGANQTQPTNGKGFTITYVLAFLVTEIYHDLFIDFGLEGFCATSPSSHSFTEHLSNLIVVCLLIRDLLLNNILRVSAPEPRQKLLGLG